MEKIKQKILKEYASLTESSLADCKRGALKIKELSEQAGINPLVLHIPKIYTAEEMRVFEGISNCAYNIFSKAAQKFKTDAGFRELFPFSKELTELMLLPSGYGCPFPVMRMDIFFDEATREFSFCEINTDGTSAMNEDRVFCEGFERYNRVHKKIEQEYSLAPFELFGSWVKTCGKLYGEYQNNIGRPEPMRVAISDIAGNGTIREFQVFKERFNAAGIFCEICNLDELSYKTGRLYTKNGEYINTIYRRAVTSDIEKALKENPDSIKSFITAVKDGAVCLIGSFLTQLIHNKWIFHVLHMNETKKFLSDEEITFIEKHIPNTYLFSKGKIEPERVIDQKNSYILKPLDSYASSGVFAGIEHSTDEWRKIAASCYGKGYICQDYMKQYKTENYDFINGDGTSKDYINMTGLYMYAGKLVGFYSRLSEGGIIASHRNERVAPTYLLQHSNLAPARLGADLGLR